MCTIEDKGSRYLEGVGGVRGMNINAVTTVDAHMEVLKTFL